MNIIVNASNLKVGGGVQVAASFLNEIASDSGLRLKISAAIVSGEVYAQLSDMTKASLDLIVCEKSPSKLTGFLSRRLLDQCEKKYNPDVVFSVFGPTYWRPKKAKHLVGFALPWLIYDTKPVLNMMGMWAGFKTRLLVRLQAAAFKKSADWLVAETEDAAMRAANRLGFLESEVHVVSNTASGHFQDYYAISRQDKPCNINELGVKEGTFSLLSVAHPHIHKNLSIIPEVIRFLPNNVKFIVTVSDEYYEDNFCGFEDKIINLGRVDNKDCPRLYQNVDAVFLPSLLECFSANYPEAFISGKVIITSNLPFANTICKDAAYYFDPLSPEDIANVIKTAINNKQSNSQKIDKGRSLLINLKGPKERAISYLSICDKLVNTV